MSSLSAITIAFIIIKFELAVVIFACCIAIMIYCDFRPLRRLPRISERQLLLLLSLSDLLQSFFQLGSLIKDLLALLLASIFNDPCWIPIVCCESILPICGAQV